MNEKWALLHELCDCHKNGLCDSIVGDNLYSEKQVKEYLKDVNAVVHCSGEHEVIFYSEPLNSMCSGLCRFVKISS